MGGGGGGMFPFVDTCYLFQMDVSTSFVEVSLSKTCEQRLQICPQRTS